MPKTTYKRVGIAVLVRPFDEIEETNCEGQFYIFSKQNKYVESVLKGYDKYHIVPCTITYSLPKALKAPKKK